MKLNQLLISILKEIEGSNCEEIVGKYLKNQELETKIDLQDLLLQLIKSVEKDMFSCILNASANIESAHRK